MAANLFLVVSGDPKWLQTSFWSFRATRNGCKPLFSRFGRPEMAANLFLVVSGDLKWPRTSFWSFRAKRCDSESPPHLFKRWIEGWRREEVFIANRSPLGIAASPAGRVGAYRIRPFRRLAGPNTDTGVCPFRDICRAYAIRPYRVTCIHPLRAPGNYPLPSTLYPLPSKIHHPNALSDIHVPCTFIVCSITSRAMPSPPASGEM